MRRESDEFSPTEVVVARIDVPFLELTWFFIKASLAMALAFSVTSWLWVLIGTAIVSLSAALLFVLGIPAMLIPQEPQLASNPAPSPAIVTAAPAPAPEPLAAPEALPAPELPQEPEPEATKPPVDPHRAATEAAQRAELERIRREKAGR